MRPFPKKRLYDEGAKKDEHDYLASHLQASGEEEGGRMKRLAGGLNVMQGVAVGAVVGAAQGVKGGVKGAVDRAKGKNTLVDEEEEEAPRRCVVPGPRTRAKMLFGWASTLSLAVLIYVNLAVTNNTEDSFAMCRSLERVFVTPDYRPDHNFLSLRHPDDFYLWMKFRVAMGLYPVRAT